MDKWTLLLIGIALCVFDAFVPHTTLLSWLGIACGMVALKMMWREYNA